MLCLITAQSTAHQTIHFGLGTALISDALKHFPQVTLIDFQHF
jgi:hypothetical protein